MAKPKKKAWRKEKHDYTPKEKEDAIAMVYRYGHYSSVARHTGIPEATLHGWVKGINKNEFQEIRAAIRKDVIKGAWRAVFRSLKNAQDAVERFKLPRNPTVEQVAKIAEASERISRILKNIGVIEEKLHITGGVEVQGKIEIHFHELEKT